MRLSSSPITFTLLAALTSYPSLVAGQQIRTSLKGCLLDLSNPIAKGISCGRPNTVHFAVEWYGVDQQELQSWLRVAGCTDEEARSNAAWAAEMCRGSTKKGDESDNEDIHGQVKGHGAMKTTLMEAGKSASAAATEGEQSGLELRRR